MSSTGKKVLGYVAAYVIAGFLTFGHNYNTAWYAEGCDLPRTNWRAVCDGSVAGADYAIQGMVWPAYWLGKFALAITDPKRRAF
jgi:hypothetical protein